MTLQSEYECVIGIHYPQPMIEYKEAAKRNRISMKNIREQLMNESKTQPEHCRPSSEDEIRQFFWVCNYELDTEKFDT